WEAILRDDPRGQPQGAYHGLICILQCSPDGNIAVVTGNGSYSMPREWDSNACLIAAAPDLLAAAKVALEQMCRVSAPTASFTDAVDELDAAILKATSSSSSEAAAPTESLTDRETV